MLEDKRPGPGLREVYWIVACCFYHTRVCVEVLESLVLATIIAIITNGYYY